MIRVPIVASVTFLARSREFAARPATEPPGRGPARPGTITVMTVTASAPSTTHQIRVLLYSDDVTTRDAVRLAVGRRTASDVEVVGWLECATHAAAVAAADSGGYDVLVLDGEATPMGGMGLCRQLKNEIHQCPPILVLTGRPQDGWLATWSQADLVVPHPLDPVAVAGAVAALARSARRAG